MRLNLAWIFCIALGFVFADFGPAAPSANAQRPDNNDDDEDRGDRAERFRRWREQRENGGEGGGERGDRAERWRRWREQRERDGDGGDDGERRRRGPDEEGGTDNDENSDRRRSGEGRGGGRMDYNEYARNLVRQHDKNSNMILDGEEVNQLRGTAASADANGDKSVTVEEIVARLSNRESLGGRGRDRANRDSGSPDEAKTSTSTEAKSKRVYTWLGNGPAGKENAEKRKSYRFTPAAERWASAPSRIKSRDRNEDGQVSMSEYSRTWSARTVREFQRYDRNGDGVITPKEVTSGGE